MVTKAIEPMAVVIVFWEDCYSEILTTHENIDSAVDAYEPALRKTVGFFLAQTEHVVIVATEDDRCDQSPDAVAGVAYLPIGMVRDIVLVADLVPKGPGAQLSPL